jgi:hypothetical protein
MPKVLLLPVLLALTCVLLVDVFAASVLPFPATLPPGACLGLELDRGRTASDGSVGEAGDAAVVAPCKCWNMRISRSWLLPTAASKLLPTAAPALRLRARALPAFCRGDCCSCCASSLEPPAARTPRSLFLTLATQLLLLLLADPCLAVGACGWRDPADAGRGCCKLLLL